MQIYCAEVSLKVRGRRLRTYKCLIERFSFELRCSSIDGGFQKNGIFHESFFFEFKSDDEEPNKLVKEISALANTYGGYIFLGVNNDKSIGGCEKWTEQRIHTMIHGLMFRTLPVLQVSFHFTVGMPHLVSKFAIWPEEYPSDTNFKPCEPRPPRPQRSPICGNHPQPLVQTYNQEEPSLGISPDLGLFCV